MENKFRDVRALKLLFNTMLIGMLFFAAFSVFAFFNKMFPQQNAQFIKTLQIVAAVLVTTSVWASTHLYKQRIEKARHQLELKDKLAIYRSANILKWALLEGAILFVIICFLLTSEKFFAIGGGMIMVLFLFQYPSKPKLLSELNLSPTEEAMIE